MHGRTHNFSTIQPAPANRKPDCRPVDRNRLGFPGIMELVQKTEHQSHVSRNVHALFIRNGRAHPLRPFKMNCSVYNSELTVYSKESTIMSERATAPTTAPDATSMPVASATSATSAENLPEPNEKLTTREKVDRLRCRQFRIRNAIDRRRANLRELAAAVRRPIEYRVDMGVRADHRIADHRGDDACARIHGRRAGHEGKVLHRILPDGRCRSAGSFSWWCAFSPRSD